MDKTSLGVLDVSQCHGNSLNKLYPQAAETQLLLIVIASKYNNLTAI